MLRLIAGEISDAARTSLVLSSCSQTLDLGATLLAPRRHVSGGCRTLWIRHYRARRADTAWAAKIALACRCAHCARGTGAPARPDRLIDAHPRRPQRTASVRPTTPHKYRYRAGSRVSSTLRRWAFTATRRSGLKESANDVAVRYFAGCPVVRWQFAERGGLRRRTRVLEPRRTTNLVFRSTAEPPD